MTRPKNALVKQYEKIFGLEGIKLTITEDALEFIAEKALEYKLGARGLRSICEVIMTDAMYELPSKKEVEEFIVDEAYAKAHLSNSKLSKLRAA